MKNLLRKLKKWIQRLRSKKARELLELEVQLMNLEEELRKETVLYTIRLKQFDTYMIEAEDKISNLGKTLMAHKDATKISLVNRDTQIKSLQDENLALKSMISKKSDSIKVLKATLGIWDDSEDVN